MMIFQKEIVLSKYNRGFHLITDNVVESIPEISQIGKGMIQILIKHTSAGLTINENADPTVRQDFESHFSKTIPENAPYYKHNYEGPDDMPAHLKSSIVGCSLSIPITNGKLNLGTWQGIYFCEFRNFASPRHLVITVMGS